MRNIFGLGLVFIAVLLFGWTFHAYSTSGTVIISVPVEGRFGTLAPIVLNPGMSPVRVFLSVTSENHISDMTNDAYEFSVHVQDRFATEVLSITQTHSEKKEDKGPSFEENQQNHIIGTFDVTSQGPYNLAWRIKPERAKILAMSVSLRQNVEGMNISMILLASFCFLFGGIVIFHGRRRRLSKVTK